MIENVKLVNKIATNIERMNEKQLLVYIAKLLTLNTIPEQSEQYQKLELISNLTENIKENIK